MNGQMHRGRLFLGCIIALVATAFGFIVRALVLGDWRQQFNLSQEQVGFIQGAGLFPFAISIIIFSLIVDKIGYGVSMAFAFLGHLAGTGITIYAGMQTDKELAFRMLYVGTIVVALANGIVEAVINPVTATIFSDKKTHYLNILHAGWPGGLVLGGLLTLGFGFLAVGTFPALDAPVTGLKDMKEWQFKVALILLPTLVYGVMLMGQKFPVQERVAAGVTFRDMMREFGAGSAFLVTALLVMGVYQVLNVFGVKAEDPRVPLYVAGGVGAGTALLFGIAYRSFGRPMFVFLLLIMLLLATTELGTDGWISDIMRGVLAGLTESKLDLGAVVLIYTSFIMFVLRFFAGPIVHQISPLGLLAVSAAIAAGGLFFIANATTATMIFVAATLYGLGKTFFWPTTLGVVSEQFPRGGALMLNAIAGVGMIAVGVLGAPLMGTIQDKRIDSAIAEKVPAAHSQVMKEEPSLLGPANKVDQDKLSKLDVRAQADVGKAVAESRQKFLAEVAILPGIMFVCYLTLIVYFLSRGGYKPVSLAHKEQEAASEY